MKVTTLTLHTQFQIGQVDPRIFGGFLEHIGRAVYEGVYQPDSPWADEDGKFAPHVAEEAYNLEDALVVAGFLNSFIRHADVVKIANLAQIVNALSPIHTEGDQLLLHSTFYPIEMFSRRREGVSLRPIVTGPTYEGKTNGEVHYLDTSAVLNDNKLHVFMTNRNLSEEMTVRINIADQAIIALDSAELLTGPEPQAMNSFEQPDLIQARPFQAVQIAAGWATVTLPALSVVALTFQLEA